MLWQMWCNCLKSARKWVLWMMRVNWYYQEIVPWSMGGRRSRNSERRGAKKKGVTIYWQLHMVHNIKKHTACGGKVAWWLCCSLQSVTLKNIPPVEGRWPGDCAARYTQCLNTSSSLEAGILALAHCLGSPNCSWTGPETSSLVKGHLKS